MIPLARNIIFWRGSCFITRQSAHRWSIPTNLISSIDRSEAPLRHRPAQFAFNFFLHLLALSDEASDGFDVHLRSPVFPVGERLLADADALGHFSLAEAEL